MSPAKPKRGVGRPVTTGRGKGRGVSVNVLLSHAEERDMRALARKNKVTLAAFIRGCALAVVAATKPYEGT